MCGRAGRNVRARCRWTPVPAVDRRPGLRRTVHRWSFASHRLRDALTMRPTPRQDIRQSTELRRAAWATGAGAVVPGHLGRVSRRGDLLQSASYQFSFLIVGTFAPLTARACPEGERP